MPIMVTAGSATEFKPAPAGTHAAVCCDVVDLGVLEVNFGGKSKKQHKVNLFWQIDEDMDNGKPFIVRKRYTMSLHEKAALRKDLEAWRGRPFTPAELDGFDLEVLIGIGCMVNIIHSPKLDGGGFWANIAGIMKMPKGMQSPKIRDYIRVCDREPQDPDMPPPPPDMDYDGTGITEDDLPKF